MPPDKIQKSHGQFSVLDAVLMSGNRSLRELRVIRGFSQMITVSSGRWWQEGSEGCYVGLREHQEILFQLRIHIIYQQNSLNTSPWHNKDISK